MELVGLIFSAENIRMLVLLAFGFTAYILLKTSLEKKIDGLDHKIDGVESSLNNKIDRVESSLLKAMDEKIAFAIQSLHMQLKTNDFKHLNDTIEALTFMLEKNKFLTREDKEYIDGRLDK
ncbi:MAG: hypothetical protein LBB36_02300 [Fibromonadaceae bacterium]|jgi:hypothetical protein|nr:hypothetical protein [Fibromonadaceae bacterium]